MEIFPQFMYFLCLISEKSCLDSTGNILPDGSMYKDPLKPCEECMCSSGDVFCTQMLCEVPKCRNFKYVEGTCCDIKCFDDTTEKSGFIGRVQISIPITAKFAPETQVMIYYIRKDGEIVSSSKTFQVEKCFDNKVIYILLCITFFIILTQVSQILRYHYISCLMFMKMGLLKLFIYFVR